MKMAKKSNKKKINSNNSCKNCQEKTNLKCNENVNNANGNSNMNMNADENNMM